MKKISILALHLGYGGIEKCIVNLANTLCERYSVEIAVCYKLLDEPAFELDKRVKVKYLNKDIKPNKNKFMDAVKKKNIFKILKEGFYSVKVLYLRRKKMIDYISNKKCDVMISTRDLFNFWVNSFGREGTLKIAWEHNHYHGDYKYATNVINSCKNLDYLIVVSNDLQKFYSEKLKNNKCMCIYIPNSIDKLPAKCAKLENKRFVSVGRLSPEKGFMDLLKIYKRVLREYPDWTLDIIGDGVERGNLENYIEKNNLNEMVTLHGFQGKDYIDKILDESSIYLMTSYTESFGIVLIEAMSHGVPCIAYNSAEGAREIINSGENGYLIKNRNRDAMIKKIKDLVESKDERLRLGRAARKGVKRYTSDVVSEEWFTLIEESEVYE